MTLYNNTVKQMKTKFIISCVITVILLVLYLVAAGGIAGQLTVIIWAVFGMFVLPIEVLGMILNIGSILKGFIFPIPVISYIIECFKSLGMGFKATIWVIRNWKNEGAK